MIIVLSKDNSSNALYIGDSVFPKICFLIETVSHSVPCVLLVQPLTVYQFGKVSAPFDQLVVRAILNDPASGQHQNPIAVADGTEPVSHDDTCTFQLIKRFGYLFLCLIVQGAGSLVENQDTGFGGDCAGYHQTLLLSARYAALSFGDDGLHSHGHITDIVGNACYLGRFPRVVQCQLWR